MLTLRDHKLSDKALLRNALFLIPIILLIAASLRMACMFWGIPLSEFIHNYYGDEGKVFTSIMQFPEIYWTTEAFNIYGTTVQYMLGVLLWPFKASLQGVFNDYGVFVQLVARFLSVLMGVGCVCCGYFLGRRLYGPAVGVISAALIALSPMHVFYSGLCALDVPMSFFLLLSTLSAFRAFEKPSIQRFLILGLSFGLLMGTKVSGILFLIIPVGWCLFADNARVPVQKRMLYLLETLVSASIVYVAFQPHLLLDFPKFWEGMAYAKTSSMDRLQTNWVEMFKRVVQAFRHAIGLPALLLVGLGFVVKGRCLRDQWLVIAFLVGWIVFFRWVLRPHYVMTISPLIYVFVGAGLAWLLTRKRKGGRVLGVGLVLTVLVAYAVVLWAGVELRLNDPRTQASRYVEEHIPHGASIGITSRSEKFLWTQHYWQYPRVNFKHYQPALFWMMPDYLVVSSFDLEIIERALNSPKLLEGYVWDERHHKDWYEYIPPSPRVFKFYADLLDRKASRYYLRKHFKPRWKFELMPRFPEIRIYERRDIVNNDATRQHYLLRQQMQRKQ